MSTMLLGIHLPVFLLAVLILVWRQQQGLFFNRPRQLKPSTEGAA